MLAESEEFSKTEFASVILAMQVMQMLALRLKPFLPHAVQWRLRFCSRLFGYWTLRALACLIFPLLGARSPLRGYHGHVKGYIHRFGGTYIVVDAEDTLPRVDILRRSNIIVDYFAINTDKLYQRESLRLLGIPTERIISPSEKTYIEASELVIPSFQGSRLGVMTLRSCNFLRHSFARGRFLLFPSEDLYYPQGCAYAASRK